LSRKVVIFTARRCATAQWLKYTFCSPETLFKCEAPCFLWGSSATLRPWAELLRAPRAQTASCSLRQSNQRPHTFT